VWYVNRDEELGRKSSDTLLSTIHIQMVCSLYVFVPNAFCSFSYCGEMEIFV
jgi:hypothetical protein